MTKLPQISGRDLVRALEKYGYQTTRQRGSHIRLYPSDKNKKKITVPDHKIIGMGLLRKILRDIDISLEELLKLLKK